jgi:hypothetical protein
MSEGGGGAGLRPPPPPSSLVQKKREVDDGHRLQKIEDSELLVDNAFDSL